VQEQVKPIQSNLLTKCDTLPAHEGKTGALMLSTMLAWATAYNECAERHNALVDVVKNVIKEEPKK
jgi:hypothetical protein